jgi:transposase
VGAGLFENLPERCVASRGNAAGEARMREPVRDQIELRAVELDSLIDADHSARLFWDYVQKLDLSAVEGAIKARVHTPGQAPPSPRLLLALWLYAVSEGVGSARALARLCEHHDAYRWLCGGVSMNYHGLSDFRVTHPELLDQLLIDNVAALSAAGIIDLDEVTQDGLRVRAAAGASSFRGGKILREELEKAKRLVEQLKQEQESDHDASNQRIQAARERAVRERKERVEAALAKQGELVGGSGMGPPVKRWRPPPPKRSGSGQVRGPRANCATTARRAAAGCRRCLVTGTPPAMLVPQRD